MPDWRTILLVPIGVMGSALLCLWLAQNLSERSVRNQQRLVLLEQRDRLVTDLATQIKQHRVLAQWLTDQANSADDLSDVSAKRLRAAMSDLPVVHKPAGISVVRMPEASVVTTDDPMLKSDQVLTAAEVVAALNGTNESKPVPSVTGDAIDIWVSRSLTVGSDHRLLVRAELKLPATDAMRTSFSKKNSQTENAATDDQIAEISVNDTAQYATTGVLAGTTPPFRFQYRTDAPSDSRDFWGLTSRLLTGSGLLAALLGALAWRWHAHRRNEREARVRRNMKESGAALAESVRAIIQSGDLSEPVHAGHRALVPVAQAINALKEKTQNRLQQTDSVAHEVTQQVSKLKKSAADLSDLSIKHQDVLNLALDRLTQAVNGVGEIASVSDRAGASVREVSSHSSASSLTAQQVTSGLASVREQVRQSEKRVKGLGERVQEINQAVKKVAELSDRTGILALNASLQAAAAGPAGREFAVLADEVKRLSDSAGGTTEQIGALVSAIHNESAEALRTINAAIEQVVSASEQAKESEASIRASSTQLESMTQDINGLTRMIDLQAGASQALSSQVERVDRYNDQLRELISTQARQIEATGMQAQRLLADPSSSTGASTV